MANDDFLVPVPRPLIEASIDIAEQPAVPGRRPPADLRGPAGESEAAPTGGDAVLLLRGFP